MVGLKISSEEIKDIVPILGLTDDDQGKVYISLLSLGMATLGQISILSGLDYIRTQEALQVLVGSKLVQRIPGKVGRYIALEPFLKSFFLAYDPITLVSIRKESNNTLDIKVKQIAEIFTESIEVFHKQTLELENNFSLGLDPLKQSFTKLVDNFLKNIQASENQTQLSIEEIRSNVQFVLEQSEKLNEEIRNVNLTKVKEIPQIFGHLMPEITQELTTISQISNNALKNYKTGYKSDLESLKGDVNEKIVKYTNGLNEMLDQFDNARSEEYNDFGSNIERIDSLLENIRLNAIQKRTKFNEIREGYKEIDELVRRRHPELMNKLNEMEPLVTNSIEDIQSRKLFKGKDAFLTSLTQVDGNIKSIQQILIDQSMTLEKINGLNDLLKESEDEIVHTAEIGLYEVKKVLDEEVRLVSHNLEEIKNNVSSEFRKSIQDFLDTKKQDIQAKIGSFEAVFDQKINDFNLQLNETASKFLNNLSSLTQQTTEKFKTNLESFFKEKDSLDEKTIRLSGILGTLDKFSFDSSSDLKGVMDQISNLKESYNEYLSSLNIFTTNFADLKLENFSSTLNNVKEILNSQISKVGQQIEQEISALTFSIKEMKQKLNKIFDLSRSVGITEIESSLLSSDLVIGETAIIMMLRDLTLRAKTSLTVLMPRPELQTLMIASKLPMKTRVTIIGDFSKVPESTLKKILSSANLRLKQLDTIDFWGCIRDAEELLVCPEPKHPEKEELIGVITANENLVELFSQELMTYTTRSREITF